MDKYVFDNLLDIYYEKRVPGHGSRNDVPLQFILFLTIARLRSIRLPASLHESAFDRATGTSGQWVVQTTCAADRVPRRGNHMGQVGWLGVCVSVRALFSGVESQPSGADKHGIAR